ncbi:hypothetical protein [Kocuria palustris]|nr:hypothetical protein [Kocuria palustris]
MANAPLHPPSRAMGWGFLAMVLGLVGAFSGGGSWLAFSIGTVVAIVGMVWLIAGFVVFVRSSERRTRRFHPLPRELDRHCGQNGVAVPILTACF